MGHQKPGLGGLIAEARRRRVFRTAGLYIVGAWVLLQVADLALQSAELPESLLRFFWLAALAGILLITRRTFLIITRPNLSMAMIWNGTSLRRLDRHKRSSVVKLTTERGMTWNRSSSS